MWSGRFSLLQSLLLLLSLALLVVSSIARPHHLPLKDDGEATLRYRGPRAPPGDAANRGPSGHLADASTPLGSLRIVTTTTTAAGPTAAPSFFPSPASSDVRTSEGKGAGGVIDASNALARLGFDRQPSGAAPPAGAVQRRPLSFAWGTSMSMPWALPYWSDTVADIATQGALIAEKLLAFGADQPDVSHVALGLLNAVVNDDDGFAHSASNTELHQGHQGSFEGNGELLMYARHYMAHTNDSAPFKLGANRLVCGIPDVGTHAPTSLGRRLLTPPRDGLNDTACAMSPANILSNVPHITRDGSKAPAQSEAGWNHGKRLGQTITLTSSMAALLLPVVYEHSAPSVWPTDAVLRNNRTGNVVASQRVLALPAENGWLRLTPLANTSFPPGVYEVELTPVVVSPGPQGSSPQDSFYYAPAWVTDIRPPSAGGASVGTFIRQPAVNATSPPGTKLGNANLATRLERAALYILRHMVRNSSSSVQNAGRGNANGAVATLGIFVIPETQYSGAPSRGVNSGCSYYDLLRIGYKSSYINLRMYEGLLAYAELEASGLVPPLPVDGSAQGAAKALGADFVTQFVDEASGSVASWIGCTQASSRNSSLLACRDAVGPDADPHQLRVDYDFLPSQALAVQFGLDTENGSVAKKWRAMRDAARVQPGLFQLNLRGLETVSPRLITTSDDWALTDDDGFALRSWSQTGDWQMFRCNSSEPFGGCNGYGNWPYQGENGGVGLLGTSAFAYRAEAYPDMLADLAGFTALIDSVFHQVDRNDTSAPLLPQNRAALALNVNDTLVRDLCVARRHSWPGINTTVDAWGKATLCDYYDSVTYPLPENGVVFWAWATGLLGLKTHVNGTIGLHGLEEPTPLVDGRARGTADSAVWPSAIDSVSLGRLRAGGHMLNMTCTVQAGRKQEPNDVLEEEAGGAPPTGSSLSFLCQWIFL